MNHTQNQIRRNKAPHSFYNADNHVVSAQLLDTGCSMFVSNPRPPESRMLAPGEHYDWTPPYQGRPDNNKIHSRDHQAAAVITARVPLLMAVHDLWPCASGCTTIGHIRTARQTRCDFDVANEAWEDRFLAPQRQITWGCRTSKKPEHLILGGPRYAVVYEDEKILPAFDWSPGKERHRWAWILQDTEIDMLRESGIQSLREDYHIARGAEPRVEIAKAGKVVVKMMGEVTFRISPAGLVYGMDVAGKPRRAYRYANGVSVDVGNVITDPRLREALQLDPLPMVESMVNVYPAERVAMPFNPVLPNATNLLRPAGAKEIPLVPRRTKAPKPADGTPRDAAPITTAPITTAIIVRDIGALPPVETVEAVVAETAAIAEAAHAAAAEAVSEIEAAVEGASVPDELVAAAEAVAEIEAIVAEADAVAEMVTAEGAAAVAEIEAVAEAVDEVEAIAAEAVAEITAVAEKAADVIEHSSIEAGEAVAAAAIAEIETVVAEATAEINAVEPEPLMDARIELLVEAFAGKTLPVILNQQGMLVVAEGIVVDAAVATLLLETANELWLTPHNAAALTEIMEICDLG